VTSGPVAMRGVAAGMPSPYLPGRFAGNKPGYAYKMAGAQGPGYYRQHQKAPPAPPGADHFLSRLEEAEARDAMATGADAAGNLQIHQQPHGAAYRRQQIPPQHQQQPEWARIGVTEATRAYQSYDPTAGQQRTAISRQERSFFKPVPSQIVLGHAGAAPSPRSYQRRDQFPKNGVGSMPTDKPAGGRPNKAGPTNAYGVQQHLTSQSLNFLS
jgi:hypothetical protein